METLRASVCVAQNKKPNKSDDPKITVLKRGQENVASERETDSGVDPATFDPSTWKEDVKNLAEIAPHSEVESAMLSWRSAVGAVQAARRRELAPHAGRYMRQDPILQLAEAVKQLGVCARRARCAMWCDLTLTVALAPSPTPAASAAPPVASETSSQCPMQTTPPKQNQEAAASNSTQSTSKSSQAEAKEDKPANEPTKPDAKNPNNITNKQTDKPQEKNNQRRTPNYRKVNHRNDFYAKNQRYDNRFMHNRHPYHYLATGPIN
ncbi:hypothetical protein evm_011638 [Chilo suppressalis]|nr:hypothetical protein evm_011638 [Chilo suppressalis]